MRIIELPSFFPPYGGEFCHDQAKALKGLGHEVVILSVVQLSIRHSRAQFFTLPWGERRFDMDGVEVWQRFTHGIPKMIRPNVTHWIDVCAAMIDEYIKEHGKPDVIHAHCGKWAGCAARVASKKHGVPYVITEHLAMYDVEKELELTGGIESSWELPMLQDAYRNARLVMPVSRRLAEQMQHVFGQDFRWREQSNMIDTEFYAFRPRREVKDDEPLRIVCIAHFIPRKGYDLLFKALRDVSGREQVELHVAGRDTDSKAFHDLLSTFNIQHPTIHVEAHGLLDKEKVRSLLYHCDALVLPTRDETQGLVILEAISSGMPAIITDACPSHALPPGSYIQVPFDAISDGLLNIRHLLKTYDAHAASQEIADTVSMHAVAKSIERNIADALL